MKTVVMSHFYCSYWRSVLKIVSILCFHSIVYGSLYFCTFHATAKLLVHLSSLLTISSLRAREACFVTVFECLFHFRTQ